jgi:prepilin-type N-terminal cleavage/methylation domain-containing protein
MFLSKKNQTGFTLIEMIVSLAIFSIIVTITIGALLVLIASNQKLQGEQSVMTNLAFAMDSMTREIRTGTNYYCDEANNYSHYGPNNVFATGNNLDSIRSTTTNNPCATGVVGNSVTLQGVSFVEAGNSITTGTEPKRILYFFASTTEKMIMRKVGAGAPQPIISSGLEVVDAEFFVSGAAPRSSGDLSQPTVTIHITAKEIGNDKLYYLQTTVTQRTLDL